MDWQLAINTNNLRSDGDPEPYLQRIAEAGFAHVMWAHHAWSDFLYCEPEIRHLEHALRRTGLVLNDLHCPTGKDKAWGSPVEYVRLAGVELIKNRIRVARRLGCDVIVMHIPMEPPDARGRAAFWDRQRRTMDALRPVARRHRVRLALENTQPHNFDTLEGFFRLYGPEFLGLCYDSGHGNIQVHSRCDALHRLERIRDRVIDLHLHDNDGTGDLHWMPLSGTVDWPRLAGIIPRTTYRKKIVPVEVGLGNKDATVRQERAFLARVARVGRRLAGLFHRTGRHGAGKETRPDAR